MWRWKYNFRVRHDAEWDVDLVDMRCLNCEHAEEMELDILLEIADPAVEEAPTVCCPHCDRELLVPKDAFDQIRGGFIYKIER